MTTISDGVFLRFERAEPKPGRSTPTVNVRSKKTGEVEAVIRWHGRRGFSLFALDGKPFGPVCLRDVLRVIDTLNVEHTGRPQPSRGQMALSISR